MARKAEPATVGKKESKVRVEPLEVLAHVDLVVVVKQVLKVPKVSRVQRATRAHLGHVRVVLLGLWAAKEKLEPLASLVQRVMQDPLVHRVCQDFLVCLVTEGSLARWVERAFVVPKAMEAPRVSPEIKAKWAPRVPVVMLDTVAWRVNLVGWAARASKGLQGSLARLVLLDAVETPVKMVLRARSALRELRASMVIVVSMASRALLARMVKQEVVVLPVMQAPKVKLGLLE